MKFNFNITVLFFFLFTHTTFSQSLETALQTIPKPYLASEINRKMVYELLESGSNVHPYAIGINVLKLTLNTNRTLSIKERKKKQKMYSESLKQLKSVKGSWFLQFKERLLADESLSKNDSYFSIIELLDNFLNENDSEEKITPNITIAIDSAIKKYVIQEQEKINYLAYSYWQPEIIKWEKKKDYKQLYHAQLQAVRNTFLTNISTILANESQLKIEELDWLKKHWYSFKGKHFESLYNLIVKLIKEDSIGQQFFAKAEKQIDLNILFSLESRGQNNFFKSITTQFNGKVKHIDTRSKNKGLGVSFSLKRNNAGSFLSYLTLGYIKSNPIVNPTVKIDNIPPFIKLVTLRPMKYKIEDEVKITQFSVEKTTYSQDQYFILFPVYKYYNRVTVELGAEAVKLTGRVYYNYSTIETRSTYSYWNGEWVVPTVSSAITNKYKGSDSINHFKVNPLLNLKINAFRMINVHLSTSLKAYQFNISYNFIN